MLSLDDLKLVNVKPLPRKVIYDAKLGAFRFTRGDSYYWIAGGPMPLALAEKMYSDPVGKRDVRCAGDGGCRSPLTWATWVLGNKEVTARFFNGENQEEKYLYFVERGILPREGFDALTFHDDPPNSGAEGYVLGYHIDSRMGLKLYVDTIRENGLDKLPAPEWLDWIV